MTGRLRVILGALACGCALLLPATALASTGAGGAGPLDVLAMAADDRQHSDLDLADRPELGGVSVKRQSRKPRRTNRRLRARSGAKSRSSWARTVVRARAADQIKLKSKRHRGKRALMRRLMAVRGGLQA